MKPVNDPQRVETLFRWETLREVGRQDLWHQGQVVQGRVFVVELTSGPVIGVWRSEDGQQYFCHGLTFGGTVAPEGPISPFTGRPVETILEGYYQMIPEAQAAPGDILVWRGLAPETTPHSAILAEVVPAHGKNYLDETATKLQTKNGLSPETQMSLAQLIGIYGESYNVYRRQ